MILTRNVTWAHVRSGLFSTAQSKPSVEGVGNESNGEAELKETASEVKTLEAEANTLITSGRAPSSTSSAGSRKCGVSLDLQVMMSPGEGLANAWAAESTSHGPDKRYIALNAGEAKRPEEYILGPPRFSLNGRTHGEERRLSTDP